MNLNRTRLYALVGLGCMAGYTWLYFSITHSKGAAFDVCLLKHTTNIPCPSCGSTRSVMAIINGHLSDALLINPLGYLVAAILLVAPVWIIADIITNSQSMYRFYGKIESLVRKPKYAVPLALLVLINWFWNIKKGL